MNSDKLPRFLTPKEMKESAKESRKNFPKKYFTFSKAFHSERSKFIKDMIEKLNTENGLLSNLKYYREKEGLTKAELARRCNISRSYIANLESGRRQGKNIIVLLLLAEALNITLEDLLK